MKILIYSLFLLITILSIVLFGVKGLFSLFITIPLIIMYFKLDIIIKLIYNKRRNKKDNVYLSDRKEVEFVSSTNRRKNVKEEKIKKKKIVVKKKT